MWFTSKTDSLPWVVQRADIVKAIRSARVSGAPVCIHASLRSFGTVDGGAETVIQAFLEKGCTVVTPTFSYDLAVAPPAEWRLRQNGWAYDSLPTEWPGTRLRFAPSSSALSRSEMGSIPAAILDMPGRMRGYHQLSSFSAIGPLAGKLVSGQRPMDVYAPLRALVEAKGFVVLMGVSLTKCTLLHLAEQQAGRRLFHRWANDMEGRPMEVEAGSCSDGFDQLAAALKSAITHVKVGRSDWMVMPAGNALRLASAAIRKDPSITHCPDPACLRCNDMVVSV